MPFLKPSCKIFFLVCFTSLAISHGAAAPLNFRTVAIKHLQERFALEERNGEPANNTTIILATNRTHRIDPLNHYQYYDGGWDYKNVHYIASVVFSAATLFITAVVWFVVLGLFLFCACICCCCCRARSYGYSPVTYALSLIFLIAFTILAIAGCIILYTNQEKFNNEVVNVLESLVQKAMVIFDSFMSVLNALVSAKTAALDELRLPDDIRQHIDFVGQLANETAKLPQIQSLSSKQGIEAVFFPARLALNILAAIMLIFVFFGFLFSICGCRIIVYLLVLLAWILVTGTFILCGVFLIFRNVVADTCVALEDHLQNPTADSPMNLQFLPCFSNKTAQETMNATMQTTSGLVGMVNQYISNAANDNPPPEVNVLYHNQYGPLVPLLCDPYNSDLTNRTCDPAEVNLDNFSEEWKKYVCQVSAEGICTTEGRLTPDIYEQMTASADIALSLYRAGHFLDEIMQCSLVQNTFRDISTNHCPGLRRYSYRTYLGLVLISASVMFSCIFWLFYTRERRQRNYTKKVDKGYYWGLGASRKDYESL